MLGFGTRVGCALLVLATAACGTTVPGATAGAGPDGLGPAGVVSSGQPSGPDGPSSQAAGQAGTTRGQSGPGTLRGSGPSGAARPTSQGPSDSPVSGPGALKPGAKAEPVVVGVITSGNTGAFASAAGINANFGDQRKQSEAVASYLNSHGGILGHPVKLTFYDYDTSSSGPGNAAAACSAFTQDQHAFAAVGVAGMDESYYACAAKKGMFVLADGEVKARSFFRNFPTAVLISDAELVRKYAAEVYAFHRQGFFGSGAKIGILRTSEPGDVEGVRDGMKPALSALGLKVTDEFALNATDASGYYSGLSSAVLRFKADGVTNVLVAHASALFFMEAAQAQSYFPRIAIDSRQSPATLLQGTAPKEQLVNTWGFGYQPVQDVDSGHTPGPVSDREKLCDAVLKAAGQAASSGVSRAAALFLCDELFFLRDALAGQPDVTRTSFLRGIAALGGSYRSTLTFGTRFSAEQHDGADAYRPLRFQTGCSCFVYTGPTQAFPRSAA